MIDFFRDPAWQFVGTILAVLAIIISIVLFFAQRKRKVLAYEIISQTAILSEADEVSGKLQILFQGETVKNVHLLVIKLINMGNVPIVSADYEREVKLEFKDSEKILSAEIAETTPDNLSGEIFLNDKNIMLKPILLNPKDAIVIKILISGFQGTVHLDGRIIGVKSIGIVTDSPWWFWALLLLGSLTALTGVSWLLLSWLLSPAGRNIPMTLCISGYLVILLVIFGTTRGRRMLRS